MLFASQRHDTIHYTFEFLQYLCRTHLPTNLYNMCHSWYQLIDWKAESMLLFWKCKKNTFAAELWARINCVYWFCSSIVACEWPFWQRNFTFFLDGKSNTRFFFEHCNGKEFTHKEDKIPSKSITVSLGGLTGHLSLSWENHTTRHIGGSSLQ